MSTFLLLCLAAQTVALVFAHVRISFLRDDFAVVHQTLTSDCTNLSHRVNCNHSELYRSQTDFFEIFNERCMKNETELSHMRSALEIRIEELEEDLTVAVLDNTRTGK